MVPLSIVREQQWKADSHSGHSGSQEIWHSKHSNPRILEGKMELRRRTQLELALEVIRERTEGILRAGLPSVLTEGNRQRGDSEAACPEVSTVALGDCQGCHSYQRSHMQPLH